jgi:hypothetical protein
MPSADFCAGFSKPYGPLSPDFEAATQISWGKFNCFRRTPAGYTAMVLDGYGLRDGQLTRPATAASYPVPVRQAAASLHASSGPRLAAAPLRFTSLHHHQVGRGLSPHELLNMPSTLPLHNRWLCSINRAGSWCRFSVTEHTRPPSAVPLRCPSSGPGNTRSGTDTYS